MGDTLSCPAREQQVANGGSNAGAVGNSEGYWDLVGKFWLDNWPITLANTLEWYEFAVYSSMEPWITANFFGDSDAIGWVVFALTFAARPFGGAVFGSIADHFGRRPAVLSSITIMCCVTVGQGLTPTVPYLGPAWLLTCRLLQGLAAAGEAGSVCVFFCERSDPRMLGMSGMLMKFGGQVGSAFSSLIALGLMGSLGNDQMLRYGWRLPFLLAAFPAVFTLYKAFSIPETGEFEGRNHDDVGGEVEVEEEEQEEWSLSHQAQELKQHGVQGLLAVCGTVSSFAQGYLAGSYLQDWLVTWCGVDRTTAFWLLFSNQVLAFPFAIPFGWLGDRYGIGKLNLLVTTTAAAVTIPMYASLYQFPSSTVVRVLSGVIIPAILQGSGIGIYPWNASMFPTKIRGTAYSLYWNLTCSAGGLGPAICSMSGMPMLVGYYSMFFGVVSMMASLVALMMHGQFRETGKGYRVAYLREEPY